LQAYCVTVVEDRPILSAYYRLPCTFLQNRRTSQRGFSAIAELLVFLGFRECCIMSPVETFKLAFTPVSV